MKATADTDFRPLARPELNRLRAALADNARGAAVLTDPRDTSYAGTADAVSDDEVISAIQSVPTHY